MEDSKYPSTVSEVVNILFETLSDEDKDAVKNVSEDNLNFFHFSLGNFIRNSFGLWGKNRQLLLNSGKVKEDEASAVIIKELWRKLNLNTSNI